MTPDLLNGTASPSEVAVDVAGLIRDAHRPTTDRMQQLRGTAKRMSGATDYS
ncbi:hypothetical protein ABZY81_36510 [Streptomyces sp. NPDC006514]|uniref:hypothetical protein n=1 Tax=Streptomyces sp. NPDC006514 TaxID=3154308 RepID=UPI0033A4F9D6